MDEDQNVPVEDCRHLTSQVAQEEVVDNGNGAIMKCTGCGYTYLKAL